MGQTLTNGIYLPAEGEVRCYAGLASNWTTLDSVVGGYRAHVANENIHITSEERGKWDTGVTQAYVLRYASVSLTALGTVAFSALDNTDNVKIGDKVLDSEGKLFALTAVDTANSTATLSALLIDLSKDSDLSNYYTKPETDTLLNGKADASALTAHTGDTTIHVTAADKQTWNGKQDALSQTQLDAVNSGIDSTKVQQIATNTSDISSLQSGKANDSNVVHKSGVETISGNKTFSSINGVEPSSLSLPGDRSARIDISSYFTNTSNGSINRYTAPSNGFVYLAVTDVVTIHLFSQNLSRMTNFGDTRGRSSAGQLYAFLPVRKDDVFTSQWYTTATNVTLTSAYFIPCQGNV